MFRSLASHWLGIFFILFFPLLMMSLYSDFIRESELNARLGWLIILGGLAYFAKHGWIQKLFLLLMALMALSGALDILYAVTFSGVFTSASFKALMQTDMHEGYEFLWAYTSWENVSLLTIYLGLSYFLLRNLLFKTTLVRKEKFLAGLGVVLLLVAIQQISVKGRAFDTIPGFNGVAIDYFNNKEGFQKSVQNRVELDQNDSFEASAFDQEATTFVLVIGESMTRNHMSLYGYSRETTPKLQALRSELLVFDNVVTSFAQTTASLKLALTQANTQNKMAAERAVSLVGVFKRAGFKVWWLSNQQPMRMPFYGFAQVADENHYVSHDFHGVEVNRYDGNLLPYVKKSVNDSARKKLIIVHLMGSHLQYENRFPAEKTFFTDGTNMTGYRSNLSASEQAYINAYDNSVRYTDFILGEMLSLLKEDGRSQNTAQALLYFSDHGEEVYQQKDFKGHGPDGVTQNMVEIPFVLWRNSEYSKHYSKIEETMQKHLQAPSLLDDLFQFVQCAAGVNSSFFEAKNALCSQSFVPRERVVYHKPYSELLQERRE